jgi:hypothetical protein
MPVRKVKLKRVKNCFLLLAILITAFFFSRPVTSQSDDQLPLEYVIHISVDGLRGDYIHERINKDTMDLFGNFERLRQEGAYTFNGRTDDTHTNTIPNHTSTLTGRPVSRPISYPETAHHDYRTNSAPKPDWTLHNRGNQYVDYIASTFDVAHDNSLRTALFTGKSKFVIYDQNYNATNGARDLIGEDDHGRGKIDEYVYTEGTNILTSKFMEEMKTDPFNYTFFHFRDADSA